MMENPSTPPVADERVRDLALTLAAMALEHALHRPYIDIAAEALAPGGPGLQELIHLGAQIFVDLAHLAAGRLSGISVPLRLPYPGEYSDKAWLELLGHAEYLVSVRFVPDIAQPDFDACDVRSAAHG
jgi:hypothetical protein